MLWVTQKEDTEYMLGGCNRFGGGCCGGRRTGYPLFGGGLGLGGLLSDLLSGGVGYLIGKNSAQNQQQSAPYQPYQQPAPPYQPSPSQESGGNTQDNRLAQLRLLGQLREQGVLTEEEFQAEKQRILNG